MWLFCESSLAWIRNITCKAKNVSKYGSLKNCPWKKLADFLRSPDIARFCFYFLCTFLLSCPPDKPPFIFSGIVSDKCRDCNEDPNHYHMKNKQRHSFHGNTLFSTRINFIKSYEDLKLIWLTAYFSIFRKCFYASQNNKKMYFTTPANKIASFIILTNV